MTQALVLDFVAEPDEDAYTLDGFTALPEGWVNLTSNGSVSTCPGILKVVYPANDFDEETVKYEAAAFSERGLEPAWKVHEGTYTKTAFKAYIL